MLRGRDLPVEKFLPIARAISEKVFAKVDEFDRELARTEERLDLLNRVNAAGALKLDEQLMERLIRAAAKMAEADLWPGEVLYFEIALGRHDLGFLKLAPGQIALIKEYERARRLRVSAARQAQSGI
ncbi:MAG: hypothetical protein HY589_05745 [Candidatus Omnitrophica bacterium]|nr:hypothetical protein [Candidatus Omnitrophota bacterium]